MAQLLHILYLHDDPRDVELICSTLATQRINCDVVSVGAQADFTAALQQNEFDLIFASHDPPALDGASALAIAQETNPGIPTIIIASVPDVEPAVAMIKSGAADYVLKQRPERLGPAARRALREAQEQLERRVVKRTAELEEANRKLKQEISERKRVEAALRQSQERYERATAVGKVGVWDWNIETNEIYLDPSLKAMLGYADHEIQNHLDDWGRFVHPDDVEQVMNKANAHLDGLTPEYEVEHRMLHKDGSVRWFLARGTVLRDENGKPYRMVGADTDITGRKQAEIALQQSEKKFRTLVEALPIPIGIGNLEARLLYVNSVAEALIDYTKGELITANAWNLIHPDYRDLVEEQVSALFQQGQQLPLRFELKAVNKRGKAVWVDATLTPIEFDGQPALMGAAFDITERKQAEETLKKVAQEKGIISDILRSLNGTPDITEAFPTIARHLQTVTHCDRVSLALFDPGNECATLILPDQTPVELPPDARRQLANAHVPEDVLAGREHLTPELTAENNTPLQQALYEAGYRSYVNLPLKIQKRVIGMLNLGWMRPSGYDMAHLLLLNQIADALALAVERSQLFNAEQHSRQIAETLHAANLALTRTLDLGTVLETLLDYLGQLIPCDSITIMLDAGDKECIEVRATRGDTNTPEIKQPVYIQPPPLIQTLLKTGESILIPDTHKHPDWEYRDSSAHIRNWLGVPLIAGGNSIGLYSLNKSEPAFFSQEHRQLAETLAAQAAVAIQNAKLYEDVQAQMQMVQETQARLIHVEKMSALGRLVASITHEVNNPIQAMQGCLTLVREELEGNRDEATITLYLGIVNEELNRVASIMHRMRDFYRQSPQQIQPTDVHRALEDVLELARKQLQHSHVTTERIWAEELPAVPANVNQLKQVFLNLVLNAIDAMPEGGTLQIRTALDQIQWRSNQHLVPAICITFNNPGQPIPPEVMSRVFEPFFTTKERGTGLGLSISYGIVEAHMGEMTVESTASSGTTFTILLPVERP